MAVTIRLARYGTTKAAFYRVVVTDHRNPRDGRFIEAIGTFEPAGDGRFALDRARLEFWQQRGARPSHTLGRLLKRYPAPVEAAGG